MSKRIAVLGAGLVGQHIVRLLASTPDVSEVVALDRDEAALARLRQIEGVRGTVCDVTSPGELPRALQESGGPVDVVVCAVPGQIGLATLKSALVLQVPIVDISFMPEAPWGLDEPAKQAGVPVVVDCGLAPGLSNLCAGHGVRQLAEAQRLRILVGGLPAERRLPHEYVTVFSPADVIEEYTRPARLVLGGRVVEKPALSDVEHHDFPGIGTLESFNTDGLRTLVESLKLPFMQEKTLRYPGHAERMRFLSESGLFADEPLAVPEADGERAVRVRPRDVTLQLLQRAWRPRAGETEFSLLMVEVGGLDGEGRDRQWTYLLLDRTGTDGVTSMARTTATPAVLMALRIARGGSPAGMPGIHMLETLAADERVFEEMLAGLNREGISLHYEVDGGTSG